MKTHSRAFLGSLVLFGTVACGGRPAELVPPVGEPTLLDASASLPRIRFADGMISANDRCPVTKRKLSVSFPPVYVNGLAIGFC